MCMHMHNVDKPEMKEGISILLSLINPLVKWFCHLIFIFSFFGWISKKNFFTNDEIYHKHFTRSGKRWEIRGNEKREDEKRQNLPWEMKEKENPGEDRILNTWSRERKVLNRTRNLAEGPARRETDKMETCQRQCYIRDVSSTFLLNKTRAVKKTSK